MLQEESGVAAEISPTGAASCRTCRGKIGVGSIRVSRAGRFWHLRCWKPYYEGKARVHERYWTLVDGASWSEKQKEQLSAWTSRWNDKYDKRMQDMGPASSVERAVAVAHVAPAPLPAQEGAEREGIALLASDTLGCILVFLDERELCRARRVCKAFLRATEVVYRRRFLELHPADVPALQQGEISWYHQWIHQCCHGCQKVLGADAVLIPLLRRRVCPACAHGAPYHLVAKKYLAGYGLTMGDIEAFNIPSESMPNPHGRRFAPMTVFLTWHLMEARRLKQNLAQVLASPSKRAKH